MLNSPININQAYAQGKTLNDVWAEPFFGSLRKCQKDLAAAMVTGLCPAPTVTIMPISIACCSSTNLSRPMKMWRPRYWISITIAVQTSLIRALGH